MFLLFLGDFDLPIPMPNDASIHVVCFEIWLKNALVDADLSLSIRIDRIYDNFLLIIIPNDSTTYTYWGLC